MATMNISLPDKMRDFVELQITGGNYASNSDYVRDLIRKELVRAEKIKAMQAAITEGVESGVAEDFDIDKLIAEAKYEAGIDG